MCGRDWSSDVCSSDLLNGIFFIQHNPCVLQQEEPFTSLLPETLFCMGRYLLLSLGKSPAPNGISKVHILYALAKQGKNLGAYKFVRAAYDQLQVSDHSLCHLPAIL